MNRADEFPISDDEKEEVIPRTKAIGNETFFNFDITMNEEIDEDSNSTRTIPQQTDLLYDRISRKMRETATEKVQSKEQKKGISSQSNTNIAPVLKIIFGFCAIPLVLFFILKIFAN